MIKDSGSQSQQNQQSLNFGKLNPAYKQQIQPQEIPKPSITPLVIPEIKKLNITIKATPRLVIDKIILNNFKSYAGKQIIGPFHHNFTSVVGPNGSGKSNLIQSLLFVFGFRASWMRLNKLNQLIHKSTKMMNQTHAYVQVHFRQILDGQDGQIFPIPNSQFTIQRNVNQSGNSKYLFNKHQMKSQEIKHKLQAKGISLTNHRFLILQGQVQQITQMKQKSGDQNNPGLLEYLEQIIGSNQFVQKITSTTQQYNKIQETRHQKGERMKLVQSQLKSMTKGKDEAIKFIKLQKKVYQLRNIVLQFSYKRLNQTLKSNQSKVKQCEQKKQLAIKEQKEKMQKQIQRVRQLNALIKQENECKAKKSKLEQQIKKLQNDDDYLRTECKDKQEDLNKIHDKKKKMEQQFTKINEDSHQIISILPTKIQQLKKKIHELRQLEKQLEKYGPFEYPKQYSSLKSQAKQFDFKINVLKQKRDHLVHKNKKIQDNLKKNFKSEEEIKTILSTLEIQKQQLQTVTSKINQQIQMVFNNKKHLNQQELKLKNQTERIDQRLRQNRRDRQQNGQKNTIFAQIMKKKFPGVLGRLGDMGKAKSHLFDQIITSCCSQLDNIVVKNLQAGQKVISYLKQSKLGKVTCIIIDKITETSSYYMNKEYRSPQNTVRLFDQIIPINQDAKIAFYHVLTDTLYCADGQLAKTLAYDQRQRRRIVTKKKYGDGIITIERSGMMIGGVLKRGGLTGGAQMNIQTKQFEQGELQVEKKRIKSQIDKLQSQKDKQQEKLKQLNRDLNQIQQVYRQNKNKINSLLQQTQQVNKQNKKKSSYIKESEQFIKQIKNLEQDIQKNQEKQEVLNQKIRIIQAKQKQKQGEKVQKLRKQINQKRESTKNLQKQTAKMNLIIGQTQSKIQKNQKQTKEITTKIQKMQHHINKLNQQLNENAKKMKDLLQKVNTQQQKSKKLYEKRNQFQTINKNDQAIIADAKRRIQIIKDQIQHYKNLLKKSRQQFQKAQKQLNSSRNQYKTIISGYDFLNELDQIQRMFNDQSKKNSQSFDEKNQISILQQSIITSHEGGRSKLFPIQQLNHIQPFSQLTEQQYQVLSPFQQQLNTLLATQAVSLEKTEGSSISIIRQFKIKFLDYKQKFNQYEQVKAKLIELKKLIDTLKQKRLTMFRQGFQTIGAKLKQVYQFLTKGGDAQLELIDSLDPFSDGINFSVRPPKKSWKQINKLSGGQKTLSSLSLIFALHYYKPTPLYFMDQIDAALDYKNVSIVANYIKKRTKNAQFIIISLRNNMFELANKLVGVYKTNDMTKTLSIIPELVLKKIQMRKKENENLNP